MSRRYLARMLPVVLVAVVLSTPFAWGTPRDVVRPGNLLYELWGALTAIWANAGCILDPNGGCTAPGTDAGCIIDPHGGCTGGQIESPTPSSDEGCILDPHGGCRPES